MFLFWLGMTALNDVLATEDGISKARGRQKWTGSATLDFSLFQWLNWLVKKGIQRLFFLQSISLYLKPKWAWPLRIRISLDSEFFTGSGIFCFASGTAKNEIADKKNTGTILNTNSGRRDQSSQFCEALALIEQKSRWIVPFKVDVLPFLNTVPVCFENKGWGQEIFPGSGTLKSHSRNKSFRIHNISAKARIGQCDK